MVSSVSVPFSVMEIGLLFAVDDDSSPVLERIIGSGGIAKLVT